jgi:two-component system chemotaxis response regulator CheB
VTSGGAPPVVALVTSTGGLDALTRVLAPMTSDFGAPIIALQHQQPDRPSLLADVLRSRCALPVVAARDGDALRAGHVYVAQAGSHLLVTADRKISTFVSGTFPPNRPSADLLLTSLALSLGSQAVAVVLSGDGTDGATGATAVHHLGGVVIAADEASSKAYGMPKAVIDRDHAVDQVLSVDAIADELIAIVAAASRV